MRLSRLRITPPSPRRGHTQQVSIPLTPILDYRSIPTLASKRMNNHQPGSSSEGDPGTTAHNSSTIHLPDMETPGKVEPPLAVTLKGKPPISHINNICLNYKDRHCHQLLTGRFHKPYFEWNGDHCPWAWSYWTDGKGHSNKMEVLSNNPAVSNNMYLHLTLED